MPKLRKTLGDADAPYITALMRLIETQNKVTITSWCLNYAKEYILPIYEKTYPEDLRPQNALYASSDLLAGKIKLSAAKQQIKEANTAAKEAETNNAAQAAARAVGQAAASFYTPTCSLGFVFYALAAIAYDRAGLKEKAEIYDQIASEEGEKMVESFRAAAVEEEPNPVKINWYCTCKDQT